MGVGQVADRLTVSTALGRVEAAAEAFVELPPDALSPTDLLAEAADGGAARMASERHEGVLTAQTQDFAYRDGGDTTLTGQLACPADDGFRRIPT